MSKTRRVPQRARAIRRLAKLRETFGPDAAAERERLLRACGRASCRSGKELRSLHETLCFARAYPDNQAVLDLVQDLLDRWERRADLHALGKAVQDLGMAGVANAYPFFWPTARWLAERWPGALHVDWDNLEDADGVASLLQLLMPRAESPALEELPLTARQWVRHLKRDDEGDGTFLVRRFAEANMDERWREEVFDSLDVPFVLAPARGTPSRTTSFIAGLPLCWQTHARSTARPHLKREIERPPKRMRHVNHKHGAELVNAARVAMLTRERDLEQIAYASADDAWILEDEDGLCFVALGKVPERRFVLESTYVYLVVKNGVPVGYLQGSGLGGWAEINYNIFPPWRGRDAAALYARSLAVIHAFQHVSTFIVDPYQLGADNEEAIEFGRLVVLLQARLSPARSRDARAGIARARPRDQARLLSLEPEHPARARSLPHGAAALRPTTLSLRRRGARRFARVPSLERTRRRPAQRGARKHQRGSCRSARGQARRARGLAWPRARRVHRVERHRGLAPRRLALESRPAPRLARRHQSAWWPNRARLRGGSAERPLGRRRAGGAGERQAPGLVTLTTARGKPPRAPSSPRPSTHFPVVIGP